VTGGDTFAVKKPHADHLLGTIARAGGAPSRAVMIGDSVNDIRAAQNAGVPVIAVPFGYSDKPVESFDPDLTIDHFDQLSAELVGDLMAADNRIR
jgi:phosphoglycolate phosphatase